MLTWTNNFKGVLWMRRFIDMVTGWVLTAGGLVLVTGGATVGYATATELPGLLGWAWFWVVPACIGLLMRACLRHLNAVGDVTPTQAFSSLMPFAALGLPLLLAAVAPYWPAAYEYRAVGFAPIAYTILEIAYAYSRKTIQNRANPQALSQA